jgi:hypothetical protein
MSNGFAIFFLFMFLISGIIFVTNLEADLEEDLDLAQVMLYGILISALGFVISLATMI